MSGHAAQNAIQPGVIPQHVSVIVIESVESILDQVQDRDTFFFRGERDSTIEHLSHCLVTPSPGENKENGRK